MKFPPLPPEIAGNAAILKAFDKHKLGSTDDDTSRRVFKKMVDFKVDPAVISWADGSKHVADIATLAGFHEVGLADDDMGRRVLAELNDFGIYDHDQIQLAMEAGRQSISRLLSEVGDDTAT